METQTKETQTKETLNPQTLFIARLLKENVYLSNKLNDQRIIIQELEQHIRILEDPFRAIKEYNAEQKKEIKVAIYTSNLTDKQIEDNKTIINKLIAEEK